MALPKLNVPSYSTKLPSTGETVKYRPFLVKEEKLLFLAMESGESADMDDAVIVPLTCRVVAGSEVPMPTRLLVTSRYSRLVSNARSTPLRVRLLFSTDPDIRPIAIQRGLLYKSVIEAVLREPFA